MTPTPVSKREATAYATALLKSRGLDTWTFGFNTNKRRLGVCKHRYRRIELSTHHLQDGLEAVRDTIGHEVAHALTPGHRHDAVWRAKAIELGSNGNRCGDSAGLKSIVHKWILTCPTHGPIGLRHKAVRRNTSCSYCTGGLFDSNHLVDCRPNTLALTAEDLYKPDPSVHLQIRRTRRIKRRQRRQDRFNLFRF